MLQIASGNLDSFLRGIDYDDKPRALLFSKQSQPTLLYTLMAIKYNKYISKLCLVLSTSHYRLLLLAEFCFCMIE